MLIRRLFYPLTSLGPGERLGIWTMGCTHGCFNCMSKETHPFDQKYRVLMEVLIGKIKTLKLLHPNLHQVTISGGDPFQQDELSTLLRELRKLGFDDILVYTGYTLAELKGLNQSWIDEALTLIDVLIDGRYVDQLNDDLPLRGSSNQIIHFFNDSLKASYQPILQGKRHFQLRFADSFYNVYGILPKKLIPKLVAKYDKESK